jgi:predicted transcriptional regulator
VHVHVGHGALRLAAVGPENRPVSPEDMRAMSRLLDEAMDAGAYGYSTGLVYPPSAYSVTAELIDLAVTAELIDLARSMARRGGLYFSHVCGESSMVEDSMPFGGPRLRMLVFREGDWLCAQCLEYILLAMKQLLVEIDDDTVERLDKIAPARSRQRSAFIRAAIRRALWEIEEGRTQEAYTRLPDSAEDAYLDPAAWEAKELRAPRKAPPRR